eukprot:6423584-Pyramimonas_sp.AAC.1
MSMGYQRTTRQADSAAAYATDAVPGDTPRSRDSSKGRGKQEGTGKRKGKDQPCKAFTEIGACSRGRDCWSAKNTPNHPRQSQGIGTLSASAKLIIAAIGCHDARFGIADAEGASIGSLAQPAESISRALLRWLRGP